MTHPALSDAEVDARLSGPQGGGWQRVDGALQKRFDFGDYHRTMAFVNAVAWIAHRADHHPDLSVHHGHCVVRWLTHDAGGITARDFHGVAQVDALLSA
jgi:4a-hydroxytetrahydrobiopterin dehydratase